MRSWWYHSQINPECPEPPIPSPGGDQGLLVLELLTRVHDDLWAAGLTKATRSVSVSTSFSSSHHSSGLTYQPSRSSSDRRYVLESGEAEHTPGSGQIRTTGP